MKVLFAVLLVLSLGIVFVFYCCCCAASRADRWMEERERFENAEKEIEEFPRES